MDDFQDGYFEIGAQRLHYVEAGSGPLVIFFHGFPSFWFSFHHQMTALKHAYRVVAVDGLGVNLSSKPSDLSLYRVENLAKQLDELARHLAGEEKFYLVGHDWGGALSWTYAQQYSHRLHKVAVLNAPPLNQLLSLLATNPEQQKRSSYMYSMRSGEQHRLITENGAALLWKNAYAVFRKLPHYTAKHDEIFRRGLAQPGAIDGGINWYRANIPEPDTIAPQHYWPSETARTSVPGLLIWGETDQTFVAEFVSALTQYVTNLEVYRMPGIGHTPMLENPEEVNRVLLAFFKR